MADFVAVIRRAVDGLTENTPEMRAKVYEKAKSAVVRQLENMKPRPPEVMFKRQLDKLDDAIRLVEEEHAEAAPAEQDDAQPTATDESAAPPIVADAADEETVETRHTEAESVEQAYHEPAPVEPEPVRHEEPASVVAETQHHEEPAPVEEPVRHEDVVAHDANRVEEPAFIDTAPFANREESVAAVQDEPVAEAVHVQSIDHADTHDDPILAHAEPARRHVTNRVMEQPFVVSESEVPGGDDDDAPEPRREDQDPAWLAAMQPEPEQPVRAEATTPDWAVDIDQEPEVAPPEPVQDEPQMPRAALTETDVATGFNDFLKQEFATPAVSPPPSKKGQDGDFSWDAPFDDLPDLPKPVAFEEALEAKQKEIDAAPAKEQQRQKNARAELEDLIGYDSQVDGDKAGNGEKLPPEVSRAMSKLEGKSFRVQKHKKKRSFNPLPIAIGVVGALIVAGGAYGLYHYRADVSTLVASYMPSDKAETPSDTRAVDEKAATDTKGVEDKAAVTDAKPADDDAKPTEVASLDPSMPTKFTQRLLADGTEAETDAAKVPIDQTLKEGKTIAGQTDAGEQVASTDAAVPAVKTDDKANAETPALAVTQKMFLYEEQLGGSPVAVPGTVTWSVKNDTTSTGDKKQPMIEASLDIPGRKMKALISFKRNSDVSLPASHIIEVVFDLPDNFPEGNVEKVERVAFKQTEQDRGNSLIAVPAKITDDFHMVALNDDADARKANTELMKTRSWIDIPITYRNNRRALITIEKGASGTEAFDKVMAEWAALGAQVNNN
jgi:hypothetical protein